MAKTAKPGHITPNDYTTLLNRNNLRRTDAAWIVGVTTRQAEAYGRGEHAIPQSAALLLQAYDEGLVTAAWLREHVGSPPP